MDEPMTFCGYASKMTYIDESRYNFRTGTSMLVLGVLEEKEMYGYQIIKELEQRSETVFSLKEGTLYPILHVLEQDGFLEAYWEDTSSARKRRFYRITKKGRKELDRQKEEWKEYAGAVGKVLQLQNA